MPENEATLRTGETPVERLLKRLIHCESGNEGAGETISGQEYHGIDKRQ